MQHDQVWSSRQEAAAVCRSDSIKKNAKENGFHKNLSWV